ncbi:uncharacterized protein LOC143143725 [Ptiloglossa arizonensis]|uniref:uncharacterized protein LOC143143725 n=1 Tax=Ptiloglossa arizonensis TaxID=3350558 RepID=UPI003FA075EA
MDGMERSQYEYLRINKFFLYSIGQWPYQTLLEKILVGIVFIPIISIQAILQGGGLLTALNVNDIDVFSEGFAAFAVSAMCIVKFLNCVINSEQMRDILDMMREDWKIYSVSNKELEILCQHYEVGKRITFNYAASIYGSLTPFMMVPSVLNAADSLGFYNLSGERPLMFRVDHLVDVDKYYYPLLIHSYFGTLAYIAIVVACDTMLVVYVQHGCGLCEILGKRLQNFVEDDNADIHLHPDKRVDVPYQNTRNCVILHKHIIEYGRIMEDANTVSFFFQLGFTLIGISFTQFQAVVNLRTPNKALRFASFTMCILSILFLSSWRGQQMADSTDRIFEYTNLEEWYVSAWYGGINEEEERVATEGARMGHQVHLQNERKIKSEPYVDPPKDARHAPYSNSSLYTARIRSFYVLGLHRNNRRNIEMDGMERSQYEYLRINKFFLRSIGRWPYQALLEKILIGILFIPTVSLQVVLQGGELITALNVNDIDAFAEGFATFAISLMCLVKFFNFMINSEQMRNILDMMRDDWKIYSVSSKEFEILCQHYAVGKRITYNYAASIYGSLTPFMMVPSVLNAADSLGFYNLSGERPLMFRVDHFVDADKYYYPLLIHSYLGTLGFIAIVVACDTMLVLNVQHECGLCEILGRRLQNFVESDNADIDFHLEKRHDISYNNSRTCVILHKHIIDFGKIMDDANTVSFFFQLGLTLIGISFTQFQAIINMRTPNKALRFISFTICILSILFLSSWQGQHLSDSTDRIYEYTVSGKWYYSSISSRKLLTVMLAKSIVPIKMTAGKLYTLNLENFTSVLRTSFSYCMVLCSFQ